MKSLQKQLERLGEICSEMGYPAGSGHDEDEKNWYLTVRRVWGALFDDFDYWDMRPSEKKVYLSCLLEEGQVIAQILKDEGFLEDRVPIPKDGPKHPWDDKEDSDSDAWEVDHWDFKPEDVAALKRQLKVVESALAEQSKE